MLKVCADYIVYSLIRLNPGTHLGKALNFFIYDTVKIFLLAFRMAVTALSFPEAVILRDVLKIRLPLIFFSIVATAIIGVGYLFNSIL